MNIPDAPILDALTLDALIPDAPILDAPWVGKAVGVAVLAGIAGFFWLSRWLDRRGVLKNYSRGLGRGLFEVETMLRPSRQYVREVKEERRTVEDDDSGPPKPE